MQDSLRQLADGPVAASAAEHRIGTAPDGPAGIGGCEQQSDNRPNGQIVEVIANKGRLLGTYPQFFLKGSEGGWFVLDAHKAMVNAQLPCPHLCSSSLATTEKGNVKPRLLQQTNTKTIANIKALAQLPLGIEPEAPIGEHTINVEHEQLNRSQAAPQQPPAQFVHARPA